MPNRPGNAIRWFGDYLLLGEIASGGMGVVLRARQLSLNRKVALKLIRSGSLASESEVIRFHTEAEAAARLDHPNIVPIYEVGQRDGQHFVSMQLIEGDSLAESIEDGKWRVKEKNRSLIQRAIALLLAKVARAVHHAHSRDVLHRDLKPGNILLDEAGEPHLTDFGLAKLIGRRHGQTESDVVMGTPSYMAPEQAAGKGKHLTTACDIYSLGAILYELLTGHPPFRGVTVGDTIQLVQNREPLKPRRLNLAIDPDLETVCLKCLEKDPVRRYASAEALAEDLERWFRGEPILARPVPGWEHALKWIRRHPVTAGLSAAVALSLLIGLAGVMWQQQKKNELNVRRRLQRAEAHFSSDSAYLGLAELAGLLRNQPDNRVAAERLLNALTQRVFFLPSTNVVVYAREQLDLATNGNYRAVIEDKVHVRVSDAASGTALFTLSNAHEKVIRSVRFSSDGTRLVTASGDHTVKIWDTQSQRPTGEGNPKRRPLFIFQHSEGVHYSEFSPDGSCIVTASRDQTARVWNATNGLLIGEVMRHSDSVNSARFSPDGRLVVTAGDDGALREWDARTGQRISEPAWLPSPVEDAYWTADGHHIIAFPDRGEPSVFKLTARVALTPTPYSLAGEIADLTSLKQQLASRQTEEILFIDQSADGRRIATASADKTARLWDARTLQPLTEKPLEHFDTVNCVRFSSDGLRLVTSTANQKVRLWDAHTGQPLSDWIDSPEPVACVWFSEDDRWVLTSAAWKWELARVEGAAPGWLAELAEAVAEWRFRKGGPGAGYLRLRATILRSPGTNRLENWAKEFVKDEDQLTPP